MWVLRAMNDFTKEIEKAKTRLFDDIQYALQQFNRVSNEYCGWEKQNEIKRECLFRFYGFYQNE